MGFSVGAVIAFNQRLESHPNMYATYRQLMRRFATGELDAQPLVSELETLFKSHDDFLHGYRMFLPPEIQSTLPSLPPRQFRKNMSSVPDTTKLRPCIAFMNKVRKRFGNEPGAYLACLDAIKELSKGKLSNKEVYDTAAKIFGDENQDLVDDFVSMLGKRKINKKKEENKLKKAEEENVSPKPSASPSSSSEENRSQKSTADDQTIYNVMEDQMHHEIGIFNLDPKRIVKEC